MRTIAALLLCLGMASAAWGRSAQWYEFTQDGAPYGLALVQEVEVADGNATLVSLHETIHATARKGEFALPLYAETLEWETTEGQPVRFQHSLRFGPHTSLFTGVFDVAMGMLTGSQRVNNEESPLRQGVWVGTNLWSIYRSAPQSGDDLVYIPSYLAKSELTRRCLPALGDLADCQISFAFRPEAALRQEVRTDGVVTSAERLEPYLPGICSLIPEEVARNRPHYAGVLLTAPVPALSSLATAPGGLEVRVELSGALEQPPISSQQHARLVEGALILLMQRRRSSEGGESEGDVSPYAEQTSLTNRTSGFLDGLTKDLRQTSELLEQGRRLRTWMAENISFGPSPFALNPIEQVYYRGIGGTLSQCAMAASILREIGYPVRFALGLRARPVGVFKPHCFLEVWDGDGWRPYDLTLEDPWLVPLTTVKLANVPPTREGAEEMLRPFIRILERISGVRARALPTAAQAEIATE